MSKSEMQELNDIMLELGKVAIGPYPNWVEIGYRGDDLNSTEGTLWWVGNHWYIGETSVFFRGTGVTVLEAARSALEFVRAAQEKLDRVDYTPEEVVNHG